MQNHISEFDARIQESQRGSIYRSADIPVCRVADFPVCFPHERRNSTLLSKPRAPTHGRHPGCDFGQSLPLSALIRPEWNKTERFRSKMERPFVPSSPFFERLYPTLRKSFCPPIILSLNSKILPRLQKVSEGYGKLRKVIFLTPLLCKVRKETRLSKFLCPHSVEKIITF